jgi:outer membrane receptor protein involved in Fe transport
MKYLRHLLLAYALVSVIATQAEATTVITEIDEVVVTASRRPVTSGDISAGLSLLDGEAVLSQKLTTDALSSNVGIYLQQTTPGQGAAIIRGLKGSAILHLVDGMPLSNAIFRSAPTPYLALVPTTAVERIEVIRGTPASLYGSQAVGGVIQVVSRVPHFESEDTQFRRDLMLAFDTAELQQSIKGVLDVGNRRLAASLSGEYLSTGDRQVGGGSRISPSGYTSKAARFVLNATPSDSRSWLFDLQFVEQPKTPRIDELVPGFGQTQPASSEFFFAPNQRLFAHAQHTMSDAILGLDWHIDAAWQRVDDDRITRNFEATTRRHESNRSDLYALSINAIGESSSTSWIVGADLQTDEVLSARHEEDIATGLFTLVQSRFPSGSRIDQAALFGNMDWTVSDRHHINGGLRVTTVEIDVPATPANAAATIDIDRLSGDLGWNFSFTDTWQFVANAGIGFRAPNISDLGTLGDRPGNRFNIPNTDLKEERVQQLDIGVRKHAENMRFELMIYALRFDDRITSVLTGDVTNEGRDVVQSVNAAESSIHGAEAGIDIDISDNMRAHAVLNYTWGRETIGSEASQPADRIPPLSGELSLQFDLNMEWSLESWLTVAGEQNRLSDRDIRDIRIDPEGTEGWAILGTKASWRPDDIWKIDLVADNLLDKRYRVHGSGIDAPGRNFSIMIRTTW